MPRWVGLQGHPFGKRFLPWRETPNREGRKLTRSMYCPPEGSATSFRPRLETSGKQHLHRPHARAHQHRQRSFSSSSHALDPTYGDLIPRLGILERELKPAVSCFRDIVPGWVQEDAPPDWMCQPWEERQPFSAVSLYIRDSLQKMLNGKRNYAQDHSINQTFRAHVSKMKSLRCLPLV